MIDLSSLYARLRQQGDGRDDPALVALKVIERVSGVSRKTILRWRYKSPTLGNLVSVVEAMGGRVVIEMPQAEMSTCESCLGSTVTVKSGTNCYCGRCGAKKGGSHVG